MTSHDISAIMQKLGELQVRQQETARQLSEFREETRRRFERVEERLDAARDLAYAHRVGVRLVLAIGTIAIAVIGWFMGR